METDTPPIHKRATVHIMQTANVCDEWCRSWRIYDRILPTAFLFGVLCFLIFHVTIAPPINFPGPTLINISKNETLDSVAQNLKDKHLIRSTTFFIQLAKIFGANSTIVPGEYFFPSSQSIISVARRLAHGNFELVPVKVTLPEGVSTFQMAEILAKKIPDFDKVAFLKAAQTKEGYLFPDTYFFVPGNDPLIVISTMESNFKRKIREPSVASAIASFGKPISEIVTMASLLEKEANDLKSKKVIAGILWRRLEVRMPLQVDAVFPYIIGKNSLQLTRTDLKVNSPYNTYIHKGLPPGPITNPGIDSILAAVTPVPTTYVFYLSDLNGDFHYSATYTEHLAKQKHYLK